MSQTTNKTTAPTLKAKIILDETIATLKDDNEHISIFGKDKFSIEELQNILGEIIVTTMSHYRSVYYWGEAELAETIHTLVEANEDEDMRFGAYPLSLGDDTYTISSFTDGPNGKGILQLECGNFQASAVESALTQAIVKNGLPTPSRLKGVSRFLKSLFS